jgi:hypothetical protein
MEQPHVPVQVVHDEQRLYAGAARNLGVQSVESEWVAFLDSDVLPAKDYCASVAEALEGAQESCLIGSVGMATTGGYWGRCMWYIEFGSVHDYLPERFIATGPSLNMIVKRDVFLAAGGFPADVPAGEDAVCQLKIRQISGLSRFRPVICVAHHMARGFASYYRHLLPLGVAAAKVRSEYAMQGSKATSSIFLAMFLWVARILQMSWRVLRYNPRRGLSYFMLLPGILIGLIFWNLGFLRYLRNPGMLDLEPEIDGVALAEWRRKQSRGGDPKSEEKDPSPQISPGD